MGVEITNIIDLVRDIRAGQSVLLRVEDGENEEAVLGLSSIIDAFHLVNLR